MTPAYRDRRHAPRAILSLPLRVRPVDSSFPEEICKTLNVSRTGLHFVTEVQHYCRDMNVYVTRNFHPSDRLNLEEKGTVVRVERRQSGKWGSDNPHSKEQPACLTAPTAAIQRQNLQTSEKRSYRNIPFTALLDRTLSVSARSAL